MRPLFRVVHVDANFSPSIFFRLLEFVHRKSVKELVSDNKAANEDEENDGESGRRARAERDSLSLCLCRLEPRVPIHLQRPDPPRLTVWALCLNCNKNGTTLYCQDVFFILSGLAFLDKTDREFFPRVFLQFLSFQ